nr:hypothetical protein [Tanacetum cinerariifolium]
ALGDKIICDLDKTPNFSQRSPQNCPKCGNPVKGHYCQGCAFLRQTFKEDLFASGVKHGIIQDFYEPAHYGYNCPPKVPIIPDPEPFHNQIIKELPPTMQSFDPKPNLVHTSPHVSNPPPQLPFISCEFCGNDARYGHYCTPQVSFVYPEQCHNQDFNFPKKKRKSKNHKQLMLDIRRFQLATMMTMIIILQSPQMNPLTLQVWGMHDTVPAMESDEFIKSSVENLVPIPSESEGESECDVPVCVEFTTFSNVLFDAEYESDSSDDQSFSDEDVHEKIFSNHLFEEEITPMKIDQHHHNAESDLMESLCTHDSSLIISSKIDSLLDEFADELALLKLIPSGIDETDCDFEEDIRLIEKLLYDNSSPRPPEEFVSDNSDAETKSFSPSPILDDGYDSERDILIFEDLPSNDTHSLPEKESFHFDIPSFSRPPAKPPDGDTGILNVKMMGDTSD